MSDLDFSSNEAKASYGIGLQMGQQLAGVFNGVSLEAAIAGINDAFSGKGPQIPGEDINAAFQVIQAQVETDKAEQAKQFAGEGEAFLADNAKKEGVQVTESGIQYEVLTAAEGDKPAATDTVKVHYKGTFLNGETFDSSYDRGEPAVFPLNRVIKGWTEGVQLMSVGSKFKFTIPSDLAYGPNGNPPRIPGNSVLEFEIELLEIQKSEPAPQVGDAQAEK